MRGGRHRLKRKKKKMKKIKTLNILTNKYINMLTSIITWLLNALHGNFILTIHFSCYS